MGKVNKETYCQSVCTNYKNCTNFLIDTYGSNQLKNLHNNCQRQSITTRSFRKISNRVADINVFTPKVIITQEYIYPTSLQFSLRNTPFSG